MNLTFYNWYFLHKLQIKNWFKMLPGLPKFNNTWLSGHIFTGQHNSNEQAKSKNKKKMCIFYEASGKDTIKLSKY